MSFIKRVLKRGENNLKLSIILPIYNVEKYIDECLKSLFNQDIDESYYEIICINDGSTDNTEAILNKWKSEHKNIKIFNQKNSGVSRARNVGLDKATGKYIWFIDPDDFIEGNCFKFIIDSMENNKADLLEISYRECSENAKFLNIPQKYEITKFNVEEAAASACVYVFLKKWLVDNNIKWNEELSYGEDYLFTFEVKNKKNNNIYTENIIYNYRQREGSAMNSKSVEKSRVYISSMIKLSQIYEYKYNHGQYRRFFKENLIVRKNMCIQGVLLELLTSPLDMMSKKHIFSELKKLNLFPYKPIYFNLKYKGNLKNTIISYISFFFIEPFFLLCLFIRSQFLCKLQRKVGRL